MKDPTHCEHCGEPLEDKPRAELARHDPDSDDQLRRIIVHQDICAEELLKQEGWGTA